MSAMTETLYIVPGFRDDRVPISVVLFQPLDLVGVDLCEDEGRVVGQIHHALFDGNHRGWAGTVQACSNNDNNNNQDNKMTITKTITMARTMIITITKTIK